VPDRQRTLNPIIRYAAFVLIAVVCVYAVYCLYCAWWWRPVTTVVVVRHAEKLDLPGDDDPLDPDAGVARAQTLTHVLEHTGVTAVYATGWVRTQDTAQPTAAAAGLAVLPYADAAALADTIRADHSGGVVLVVGHSNTVTTILEELGGDPVGLIADSDYDNLFVVTLRRCGGTRVTHLQYGEATS